MTKYKLYKESLAEIVWRDLLTESFGEIEVDLVQLSKKIKKAGIEDKELKNHGQTLIRVLRGMGITTPNLVDVALDSLEYWRRRNKE